MSMIYATGLLFPNDSCSVALLFLVLRQLGLYEPLITISLRPLDCHYCVLLIVVTVIYKFVFIMLCCGSFTNHLCILMLLPRTL
jgi:hypothetical protein